MPCVVVLIALNIGFLSSYLAAAVCEHALIAVVVATTLSAVQRSTSTSRCRPWEMMRGSEELDTRGRTA
jgi:hypothetical protein